MQIVEKLFTFTPANLFVFLSPFFFFLRIHATKCQKPDIKMSKSTILSFKNLFVLVLHIKKTNFEDKKFFFCIFASI